MGLAGVFSTRSERMSSACDEVLSELWQYFLKIRIAKWDMLEAYVAGFSFLMWIVLFRVMDQMTWLHKYRISNKKPIGLFRPDPNYSWMPLVLYFLAIHIYHMFVTKPPVSLEDPTVVRVTIELTVGIFYYDFVFFWLHWAMHASPSFGALAGHHVHHAQYQVEFVLNIFFTCLIYSLMRVMIDDFSCAHRRCSTILLWIARCR